LGEEELKAACFEVSGHSFSPLAGQLWRNTAALDTLPLFLFLAIAYIIPLGKSRITAFDLLAQCDEIAQINLGRRLVYFQLIL
jgi:hypothetical protein